MLKIGFIILKYTLKVLVFKRMIQNLPEYSTGADLKLI